MDRGLAVVITIVLGSVLALAEACGADGAHPTTGAGGATTLAGSPTAARK